MSFTEFLVSFACHIAKSSLRALKKTYVDRSLWSKSAKKQKQKKHKKQKKQ